MAALDVEGIVNVINGSGLKNFVPGANNVFGLNKHHIFLLIPNLL